MNLTAKPARTDLGVDLEERVYPALFDRADTAFPQFSFRKQGPNWVATQFPTDLPIAVQHKSPDRLVYYPNSKFGFVVHGHGIIRWLDYVNGGSKPDGADFIPAVRKLCERAGVPFPERELNEEEREQARCWEERRVVLSAVLAYCQATLWSEAGAAARAYLHSRGFTDEEIRDLGFGFYDSVAKVRAHLKAGGLDLKAAQAASLLWSHLEGYAVLPWNDAAGGTLTLYFRWPGPSPRMIDLPGWRRRRDELMWEADRAKVEDTAPWQEPSIPKTLALPGDGTKGCPLFFDRARKAGHRDLLAVEGMLDGAILQCRGETRAVAYVAAQFSGQQVETLKRHKVKLVIICPDPDGGGAKGAESSVKALAAAGIAAYVAPTLPDGLDPDEFLLRGGIDGWREHVANPTPGAVYVADRMLGDVSPASPDIERRPAADKARDYAGGLADPRDRSAVLGLIAERTGYRVEDLGGLLDPTVNGHHKGEGETVKAGEDGERPRIVCGSETPDEGLKKWTPKALDALAQANRPEPSIFQRGGSLVRMVRAAEDAHPVIMTMDLHALRGQLDRAASWGVECFTKKGIRIKWGPPLLDVVRDIMALPCYDPTGFPYLDAIVEAPRFLADGSLLTKPGYDRGSRLFHAPRPELADLDIPERPTVEAVRAALGLIFDNLLIDFPFANDASRANALACMLLYFVRSMIDGPTPLHMFEASTEGTGKGLLASACALPALGHEPHATPQKEDEAEWRKAITTSLLLGHQGILFDNMYMPKGWEDIPYPIDSPVLAAALTLRRWTDRILGGNTEADLPINCVWMGTGNNVEFSRELARRVVPIRLDAVRERPWERTDFKHDLPEWAIEHRRELVAACLTLIRRWISEGMPSGSERLGSYEAYSRIMGGILGSIGVKGFLANKVQAADADQESPRWGALCRAWWRERKGTLTATGHVWDLITKDAGLHEAFVDVLGDGQPLSQKKKLGKALARHVDRVWSNLTIKRSSAASSTGNAVYKLVPTCDFREQDMDDLASDDSEQEEEVPF